MYQSETKSVRGVEVVNVNVTDLHPGWQKFFELKNFQFIIYDVVRHGFYNVYARAAKGEKWFLKDIENISHCNKLLKEKAEILNRDLPDLKSLPRI